METVVTSDSSGRCCLHAVQQRVCLLTAAIATATAATAAAAVWCACCIRLHHSNCSESVSLVMSVPIPASNVVICKLQCQRQCQ
jgi:hypothetical protein